MRVQFEIAADDSATIVSSDFLSEVVEIEREGDKLLVSVSVTYEDEIDYGNIHE
tara:strand:+ start:153 stop:314 length:162 start_codon:yes stop_codon:yes gene_type:complete